MYSVTSALHYTFYIKAYHCKEFLGWCPRSPIPKEQWYYITVNKIRVWRTEANTITKIQHVSLSLWSVTYRIVLIHYMLTSFTPIAFPASVTRADISSFWVGAASVARTGSLQCLTFIDILKDKLPNFC